MNGNTIAVRIVRSVDEAQPGWVACRFTDAEGREHEFVDKVPLFTDEPLDSGSRYPARGSLRCEILARWRDPDGRGLVRIRTVQPELQSTAGLSEFVVLAGQVTG